MKSTPAYPRILYTTLLCLFLFACADQRKPPSVDPAFSAYISAFTSGVVSSAAPIIVQLQTPMAIGLNDDPEKLNELLELVPKVDGTAHLEKGNTIIFEPSERLQQGKEYQVVFKLGRVTSVPEDLREFIFDFRTVEQSLEVGDLSLAPYENGRMERQSISGVLSTADLSEKESIAQTLTALQDGNELKVSWSHDASGQEHRFTIDSVARMDLASSVTIQVNGKAIGAEEEFELEQEVPALGDFKVLSSKVVHQPDQFASITFSDPINKEQDLAGLVELVGLEASNTEVRNNELRVYPPQRLNGEISLIVSAGLENILGFKLGQDVTVDLLFEETKPLVRTVGTGTILPSTDGTLFPFEAVNLAAVEVSVIRIYENNILQFLQSNQLGDSDQIRRVGRPVAKKTIRLDQSGQKDLGQWNRFFLDLADLVKAEPGAIYRVELGFKKKHALYACAGQEAEDDATSSLEQTEDWDSFEEDEASFWDFYDNYYYDWYYGDYDYHDREDPCTDSYYGRRRSVAKNFMASDIGLIVKGGNDKSMLIAANDLISTRPLEGAKLNIYNFQDQLIHTLRTDAQGMARIDVSKENPFLLIAEHGGQKGYLKLDDGSSMNLSKFDIHGHQMQKGLKGFIYGDRGVWRPGDSLFLAFMLEDAQNLIPDHHPVTMELVDPRGQRVSKTVHKASKHGFYDLRTATSPEAPTGNWHAQVKIGNAVFTKNLRIETVKPNRLKIELDLGEEILTQESANIQGTLAAKWLHGAIAKDLNARIELSLQQGSTNFERYPDFEFDDPVRRFRKNEMTIFDGNVDENGQADIDAPIHINDEAPGMLKANFVTRVFEKSGDHSIDRHSITYSPYATYVGLKLPKGDKARGMLLTDTVQTAQIRTVGEDGKPLSKDSIHVAIYQIQWRWWWQGGNENLKDYFGTNSPTLIKEDWISTNSKGEGSFDFQVDYPSWGRYLVRAKDELGGHATGKTVYMDWPGWAGRAQRSNPEAEQMLVLSADKEKYNVGQKAELFIPTGEEGRALLTVENGSHILHAEWIEAVKGGVKFQLPITSEMAPNVYAHVSYLQPHGNTRNSLPIRMFGVIPIMVEDPGTILQPELQMAKELKPEQKTTLKVKEQNGRPMTYTIAMVDEGLLDLTRFKTPDPWGHFFAKEALGVRTWDLYDMVIGAFGGRLSPLLALGGDGEATNKGMARAERFKPMVRYMGPFTLQANATAEHVVQMPNYVGSVRTMVVAGNGKAYGHVEQTTPVKKPLMVLATLPRVVGPGETVKLPVTVFAMDKKVKDVQVKLKNNDLFQAVNGSTQSIRFDRPGDQIVEFELKVAELLGAGQVIVEVKSGNETAHHKIDIEVRNPNPPMVTVIEKIVPAGESMEVAYQPIGMAGTNNVSLELSTIPPINMTRRLQYLLRYPHGCVEQTTSAAFPQLFLSEVMELNEEHRQRSDRNVKAAIQHLASFQLGSGGLSYWPGNSDANNWGTTYAGHFLLEAEQKGYALPSSFRANWVKFQKKEAKSWRRNGDRHHRWTEVAQAYRLYTLALANAPELGAMNRLRSEKNLQPMTKWRLAAAYQLAGKPEVAQALVKELGTHVEPYKEMSYSYGSTERDMAMIIEALVIMGDHQKAAPIVRALSKQLSSQRWFNTQATAYSLMAISKYAGTALKEGLRYQVAINGGDMKARFSQRPLAQRALKVVRAEGGYVQVKNENSSPLHLRIILEGTPVAGMEVPEQKQLNMQVSYHYHDGTILDPSEVEQGTDLYALVKLSHPGILNNYQEMALTQIFPSGWEIRNNRMDGMVEDHNMTPPTYQDIRDDRVLTYFDLARGNKATFKVRLNAAYLGEFYLPAVSCGAMYDNDVKANTAGQWVRVVPPGGTAKASK